jgi:glucose-1-phosphatase
MTFLFDIGRVLLDFDFETSLARLLPADVLDGPDRLRRLIDRKDEFESGVIETEAYVSWALETLGSVATPLQFRDAWQRIFTPVEPMWACVRRLSDEGHRMILFSNTNGIHTPWIFETYPGFSLFHGAVLSHQTGFVKPQPEIYEHAIALHGLDPARTLYIDDLPQNIEAGRRFGFRCWQYELANHAAFEDWLAAEMAAEPTVSR